MDLQLIFPTPVYIKDIATEAFNQELEKNIFSWAKEDGGITKTNVNGWHSADNMHERKEFKGLVDLLFEAQYFIYKQEIMEFEPVLGNMWANINPPGGYNIPHIHPNSLWSGVYYVKTPNNCGSLILDDPKTQSHMMIPKRKSGIIPPSFLWKQIEYIPKAGRLIMFPSWLNHWVNPNKSDDTRISVSFNFTQKSII
jgi:uncharacterized protein (TIGR02466 family)